jgi:hypothetical protein
VGLNILLLGEASGIDM